jgi:hypothetical protein
MASSFSITLTPDQKSRLWGTFQDKGTLPETEGVILSYSVDHATNTVTFTVDKKPALVPVFAIENHVKALIGG